MISSDMIKHNKSVSNTQKKFHNQLKAIVILFFFLFLPNKTFQNKIKNHVRSFLSAKKKFKIFLLFSYLIHIKKAEWKTFLNLANKTHQLMNQKCQKFKAMKQKKNVIFIIYVIIKKILTKCKWFFFNLKWNWVMWFL